MIVPVLSIVFGLILLVVGTLQLRLYTTMTNLATSPINAIAAGTVEVVGTSECKKPLTSPLSQQCAGYEHSVYLRVQTKNGTTWKRVSREERSVAFTLRDASGSVKVHPSKAKVIMKNIVQERRDRYKGNRDEHKFVEHIIPLDTQLYVVGNAQVEGDKYVIKSGGEFVITDNSEKRMVQQYLLSFTTSLVVGTLLIVFGVIQVLNIRDWQTFLGAL